MNQGAVLHKGPLTECKVCNSTTAMQEKRVRRARSKMGVSLDVVIRRQVAFDLGEDEPKKDERFQLLQKYGVAAPRIDRQMTKPNWMGVAEFKRKLNDWYKLTKGMIQPQQRTQWQNRTRGTIQDTTASTRNRFVDASRHGNRPIPTNAGSMHSRKTTGFPSKKFIR